ncbi:MAG: hypothetical protein K1X85_12915 [Ignavibacteria bacterium]|nr:hypothetical protein [Ignavibacteria bacterium]
MKLVVKAASAIAAICFCIYAVSEVGAYPRFAAYTGDKCMDCHVNPTGGIMRSYGGMKFAEKNLEIESFRKLAGKTKFDPRLTKAVSIGGDVRVAQVDNQVPDRSNYNSFLAMQGDVYLNVELNKIVDVFATSGIYIPGVETRYEVYGMLHNLPANGFFKAGRFKPDYGTRIVEHRAFQRKNLLGAPYEANTGFEIGISPEWFTLTAGLYNPASSDFISQDPHKMFVASTDFNFAFSDFDYTLNIGASFLNNPYNTSDSLFSQTITGLQQSYGADLRLGFFKRAAVIAEVDFEERKTDYPLRRSLYLFGELDVMVINGLELRGQYEYYDRNRDVEEDHRSRISAGFAAFPFYGFETEVMLRFVDEPQEQNNDEFQWNFHFYF